MNVQIKNFLEKAFTTNKTFVIHFSNKYLKLNLIDIIELSNYIIKSAKDKKLNIIFPYIFWKSHLNLKRKIINLDKPNKYNSFLLECLRKNHLFFYNNDFYLTVGILSKNKYLKKKFILKNNQNIFENKYLYNIFEKSTIIGLGVSSNYCFPFHYLQYKKFNKKIFSMELKKKVIYKKKLYLQKKKILKLTFTKDTPSKYINFNLKKNFFKKIKNKFFFYYKFETLKKIYSKHNNFT